MRIFIETLGCKVNQYESACILDDFLNNGWTKADDMSTADVVVINTCTVTNRSDYKSRYLIKKAKEVRQCNPNVKIVVTGCYSQKSINTLSSFEDIDLLVDNKDKHNIYKYLIVGTPTHHPTPTFSEMHTTTMSDRARAFVKIQDGCDCECAYCIVPTVRGKSRSRTLESTCRQVELLLDKGYTEIVLVGINLGQWEGASGCSGLSELLYTLNTYDRLRHIRLSSIEPQLWTDNLLQAITDIDKVCPHFHIPLQTGSDTLLKLHNRNYTTHDFIALVNKLRQIRPHCALGFDVIVGLPGETDDHFAETLYLLESIDFTYLHIFIYSKRKGTPAATMPKQVNGTVAKLRSKTLFELAARKHHKNYPASCVQCPEVSKLCPAFVK